MYGLKDVGGRDYWEEAGSLLDQCKPFNNFVATIDSRTSAEDIDRKGDLWTGEFTTVLRFWDDLIEPARESAAVEAQASGSGPQAIPRRLRKARYTKGTYQGEDDDGGWATDLLETKKRRFNEPLGDKEGGTATDEKMYPPAPNRKHGVGGFAQRAGVFDPKLPVQVDCKKCWPEGKVWSAILELTRKQEAGELSAFFHLNDGELPNLRGYRSLLSQNRHEGYLTFGKARRDYVDYLKHGTLSSEAFLCVQQYGPWNLTKGEQLRHFCRAATAFTLAGSDAVKK